MTFSHSNSKFVAVGGFNQQVPLPADIQSNQLASYWSAEHGTNTPLVFGTAAYTVVLPLGAIITAVKVLISTAFAGGTSPSIQLGSTLSGVDILASTALSAQINTLAIKPTIPVSSVDDQTVFVTITGGPTAGAATLVLQYINPPATLNGIND